MDEHRGGACGGPGSSERIWINVTEPIEYTYNPISALGGVDCNGLNFFTNEIVSITVNCMDGYGVDPSFGNFYACQLCSAGAYSNASFGLSTVCNTCPGGTYNNHTGSSSIGLLSSPFPSLSFPFFLFYCIKLIYSCIQKRVLYALQGATVQVVMKRAHSVALALTTIKLAKECALCALQVFFYCTHLQTLLIIIFKK